MEAQVKWMKQGHKCPQTILLGAKRLKSKTPKRENAWCLQGKSIRPVKECIQLEDKCRKTVQKFSQEPDLDRLCGT